MQHALTPEELRQACAPGTDVGIGAGRLRGFGLMMLVIAVCLGFAAKDAFSQFFHAYLVSYAFFLSLCLGALFFVAVNHLVSSRWMVVVRRLSEVLAAGFPLMAVLFLPILIPILAGNHSLYHWTDPHYVEGDHVMEGKAGYLNVTFFTIRAVIYFLVWITLSRFFLRNSRDQDETGDPALVLRMRRLAAPGLVLFALTTTFAAFDWLMSLEPHWFSTIFGVYYFAGGMVGFFATMVLVAMYLQDRGQLENVVTVEHYHDLGKFLFAFVFFWGYIAFSQYMLIWYGDLPEETFWFGERQAGSWAAVSVFLIFGHFLVPFAGLLSRHVKRNKSTLAFFALLLLMMHWIDMYWLVMPVMDSDGLGFGFIHVACLLGLGGLFAGGFIGRLRRGPFAPIRDPFLEDSLRFRNY